MEVIDKLERAYRTFLYIFVSVAIVANLLDIVRVSWEDKLLVYSNLTTIGLMIIPIILYRRMHINIKVALLSVISILMINLFVGLYYYNPTIATVNFSSIFLRESLLIILLITAAILVNKYVAFGLTFFYIIFYIVVSHKFQNTFLIESTIIINLSLFAYTMVMLFITSLLNNLVLELDQNHERVIIQHMDLLDKTKEIERANKNLHEKNNELQESKAELTAQNSTKDKLYEIISHDLKNPFNTIIGMIEILQKRKENTNNVLLSHVQQTTTKTYDLLENLLSWAREQSGDIAFNPKSFSAIELIDNEFKLLSIQAEQKGIKLEKNISTKQNVLADQDLISIVIRNLISNAIKYTNEQGKIELIIKETTTGNKDKIQVQIVDNGIGLSNEQLDVILKDTNIVSLRGTNNEKGTGIGLKICKELLSIHESNLFIKSIKDEGSKFYFNLEIAD